jgi:hypothetical protein
MRRSVFRGITGLGLALLAGTILTNLIERFGAA